MKCSSIKIMFMMIKFEKILRKPLKHFDINKPAEISGIYFNKIQH